MQRLIQDLLAYSRVGTKGKNLHDTSSEDALQQAVVNLRGAIKESGALVTHDPLPIVLADDGQLTQLFQNLVGNAIKYQRPGIPRVHVSAARKGGKKWIFSVKDNGLGIDSQYFERIFGMFQRLHKGRSSLAPASDLPSARRSSSGTAGPSRSSHNPGRGPLFTFPWREVKGTHESHRRKAWP
jgi:light-regulated signal transduction histidine kinase (bacteriophytochrome)